MSASGHRPRSRRLLRGPMTAKRAGYTIAGFTTLVTVVCGVLMRVVDRDEFPNVWLGLWWAVQTVTTVGYGDKVPTEARGRLLAAIVMLAGIAFIAVVTASITAALIEGARRRLGNGEDSLLRRLDEINERLERLETGLRKDA